MIVDTYQMLFGPGLAPSALMRPIMFEKDVVLGGVMATMARPVVHEGIRGDSFRPYDKAPLEFESGDRIAHSRPQGN